MREIRVYNFRYLSILLIKLWILKPLSYYINSPTVKKYVPEVDKEALVLLAYFGIKMTFHPIKVLFLKIIDQNKFYDTYFAVMI